MSGAATAPATKLATAPPTMPEAVPCIALTVDHEARVIVAAEVQGPNDDAATRAAEALARAVAGMRLEAAVALSHRRMSGTREQPIVPGSLRARRVLQSALATALGVARIVLDERAAADERPALRPRSVAIARIAGIEAAIAALRPVLAADRGDIELLEIDGTRALVRMSGACAGCQLRGLTLGGLQQRIARELGEPIHVVPLDPRHLVTGVHP